MWGLLKALFFGGRVMLSPEPIVLTEAWHRISPAEPFEALNVGAELQVVLETNLDQRLNLMERMRRAEAFTSCTSGTLVTADGQTVELQTSGVATSETETMLLYTSASLPTDTDFTAAFVKSTCLPKPVTVHWRTYGK